MKNVGKVVGTMIYGAVTFCSGIIVGAIGWTSVMVWANNTTNGRIEDIFKKHRTKGASASFFLRNNYNAYNRKR